MELNWSSETPPDTIQASVHLRGLAQRLATVSQEAESRSILDREWDESSLEPSKLCQWTERDLKKLSEDTKEVPHWHTNIPGASSPFYRCQGCLLQSEPKLVCCCVLEVAGMVGRMGQIPEEAWHQKTHERRMTPSITT